MSFFFFNRLSKISQIERSVHVLCVSICSRLLTQIDGFSDDVSRALKMHVCVFVCVKGKKAGKRILFIRRVPLKARREPHLTPSERQHPHLTLTGAGLFKGIVR